MRTVFRFSTDTLRRSALYFLSLRLPNRHEKNKTRHADDEQQQHCVEARSSDGGEGVAQRDSSLPRDWHWLREEVMEGNDSQRRFQDQVLRSDDSGLKETCRTAKVYLKINILRLLNSLIFWWFTPFPYVLIQPPCSHPLCDEWYPGSSCDGKQKCWIRAV